MHAKKYVLRTRKHTLTLMCTHAYNAHSRAHMHI